MIRILLWLITPKARLQRKDLVKNRENADLSTFSHHIYETVSSSSDVRYGTFIKSSLFISSYHISSESWHSGPCESSLFPFHKTATPHMLVCSLSKGKRVRALSDLKIVKVTQLTQQALITLLQAVRLPLVGTHSSFRTQSWRNVRQVFFGRERDSMTTNF